MKGFLSATGKIVSKYCNISKTARRGSIHPSPTPLYHGRGMNLRVRPRVKQSALPGVYGYFLELYILNKVVLLTILTKWTIESRETAPFKQDFPFFTGHAD